jgi:hypothetical protein
VTKPLLLLGLMSRDAARRRLLRCTWVGALPPAVRMRFVLGEGSPAPDSGRHDVIVLPIAEQSSGSGRISTYLKVMAFMRYAATQPEPLVRPPLLHLLHHFSPSPAPSPPHLRLHHLHLQHLQVAKGDDDIFVVPQMLAAYAEILARLAAQPGREHLVAGTFDWFNFKPATLDTVGWGRLRTGAALVSSPSLTAPQLRDRCRGNGFCNCSTGGGGYVYNGWDLTEARQPRELRLDKRNCVGPFAFANGALKFFSTATVRWLVRSAPFEADIRYAEELANASADGDGGGGGGGATVRWRRRERRERRRRSEDGGGSERPRLATRVSEDAQLGVWLAALPSLHLVVFKRFEGWLNSFHHVGDLRFLLVAHRTPWY